MAFDQIEDDIERLASKHGGDLSFTADATITAGQLVTITGDNAVSPSDTDGEEVVGVATQNAAEGDTVMVQGVGTLSTVRAGEAITGGDFVSSYGGTGDAGEAGVAGTGDYVVGMATEDIADEDYGQVSLTPGGQVNEQ